LISHYRLSQAARCINAGGVIAYPTEAVYGLGCNPLNESAAHRLLQLKQRDIDKGLILIAADYSQLIPFVEPLDNASLEPVLNSWPGPYTWLLPAQEWVPRWVRGKHASLAVRVTDPPLVSALFKVAGHPQIYTSANISQRPPARSPAEVRRQFGHNIDMLLSGPLGGLENPTPIRDAVTGATIRS